MSALEKKHQKLMDVLLEIAEAVNRTRNLNELYQAIHTSLGKILNVDNFFIAIHHPDKDTITFPYYVDQHDKNIHEIKGFSNTASLTGKVIQVGKPLLFDKKDILKHARTIKKKTIGTLSCTWLGAPLKIGTRVTGAVAVQSYMANVSYTKKDLDILDLVARHIALALERKEASDALQEQGQILEKILETSPVGIALVENRTFKWVNQEMVKLFGYHGKNEFKNQSLRMIYPSNEAFLEAGEQIYEHFPRTNKMEIDRVLMRKDGSTFSGHIKLGSADAKNPVACLIATFSDITERHRAQQEKSERERLQGVLEMAGAVCHELNQPLQTLMGHSELIAMDQDPDSQLVKDMHTIQTNVSRISHITRRLAGITKYKTMKYPGRLEIVDIWESSD
ncbi:PAS domain S-box-containing protein [Desulfocicer vacuolatum DSM 3385]|uniref:histidine kinase n=1 Tax=Desulfocicer vacuolatum DSM 3385 TaxID=1121400 RepID=A0A1W2A2L8_9BACT|nr:PAS domain S-box protein [Desulfocicer vacuolatum]SMC54905.1 PAS domain S-box-containing protein [Desulfocicer vacuolatum DSM 3385]